MITENDLLLKEKRRLENALLESEIPFLICTENLNTRGQRGGIDHVVDEVDREITSVSCSTYDTIFADYPSNIKPKDGRL